MRDIFYLAFFLTKKNIIMKKLLRLSILTLLILALFTMNDCKKNVEEPKEETSISKKILLTSHIWKFNDMSSTNLLAQIYINSLNMSNATVNFDADGTYTGSMTGQTENGSWEFNADQTSIIIDKGTAYEIKANIVLLTTNVLELNAIYHDATLGDFPVTIILWNIR